MDIHLQKEFNIVVRKFRIMWEITLFFPITVDSPTTDYHLALQTMVSVFFIIKKEECSQDWPDRFIDRTAVLQQDWVAQLELFTNTT